MSPGGVRFGIQYRVALYRFSCHVSWVSFLSKFPKYRLKKSLGWFLNDGWRGQEREMWCVSSKVLAFRLAC